MGQRLSGERLDFKVLRCSHSAVPAVGLPGEGAVKATCRFAVAGMHCRGCEAIVEQAVRQIDGIDVVQADYATAILDVSYDTSKTDVSHLLEVCSASGYPCKPQSDGEQRSQGLRRSLVAMAAILGLLAGARIAGGRLNPPALTSQASAGMVVVVGLLAGLHCVGMCGSFIVGYTARDAERGRPAYRSHLLYGAGKTLSYALGGAVFGFAGSLFRISPFTSGVSSSIAGAFLVLYGLSTLTMFSALRALRVEQPAALTSYALAKRRQSGSPLLIGLLSGLLVGCGPLQAMYVMAAGNGDPLDGARFLALFGLGTLPALIGFGLLARVVSSAMTRRFAQVTGVLMIVMGAVMIDTGFTRIINGDVAPTQPGCCQH